MVTDSGANYRAKDFARTIATTEHRHEYIRPYTPHHNGKVERCNRTFATEVLRTQIWLSEADRATVIEGWNIHYKYHREHTAIGDQAPATRLNSRVTKFISKNISS